MVMWWKVFFSYQEQYQNHPHLRYYLMLYRMDLANIVKWAHGSWSQRKEQGLMIKHEDCVCWKSERIYRWICNKIVHRVRRWKLNALTCNWTSQSHKNTQSQKHAKDAQDVFLGKSKSSLKIEIPTSKAKAIARFSSPAIKTEQL